MKITFNAAAMILLLVGGGKTRADDWREFALTETDVDFYSTDSIDRSVPGTVRVWTKRIDAKAIDRKLNAKLDPKYVDIVAGRIANYYSPPLTFLYPTMNANAKMIAAMNEEVANEELAKPNLKMLHEINCKTKTVNLLSVVVFELKTGKTQSTSVPKMDYIVPESVEDGLAKLVCDPAKAVTYNTPKAKTAKQ